MSDEIYANRKPEWYAPYLDRLRDARPPLLELGAGHGLLLELARSRGIPACGVELFPDRVAICRAKGLDVTQHDLREPLSFPDSAFGMVYSGQVIEHVPPDGQRMMLREAFRVLRPGGKFLINSPNRNHEASRLQRDHDYLLTIAELVVLLRAAGFSNIDLSPNFPQSVPEIPTAELKKIWGQYMPDLIAETASALCTK